MTTYSSNGSVPVCVCEFAFECVHQCTVHRACTVCTFGMCERARICMYVYLCAAHACVSECFVHASFSVCVLVGNNDSVRCQRH